MTGAAGRWGSRMAIGDRLRTIAVTAILTSIAWIAFGGGVIDGARNLLTVRSDRGAAIDPGARARPTGEPLHRSRAQPVPSGAPGDYIIPVAGIRAEQLSDTFTDARGGGTRVHDAIDIMAPRGTPVVAATAGTLEKLFTSAAGGLTLYVRSPDRRTITYYAHLDAYAPGLAPGMAIRRGQPLGTVGFTGNADPAAPHLHFAIMQTTPDASWWEPATAINPYPLLTKQQR